VNACTPLKAPLMPLRCFTAGSATCVLGRVSRAAPSSIERTADDDAVSDAAAKQPTLWPGAPNRVMLHASTVRYLRFGSRRPPRPAPMPNATSSPGEMATQASSRCSGTGKQAGSRQPAARDARLDGVSMRKLARERLDAAPGGIRCSATCLPLHWCHG
jgi:hypothetical protein